MYYVYEWYIEDTGEIIYVGKGKGNRYKVKSNRNYLLKNEFKLHKCNSRIIKYFDNEKEAYLYEYDRVNELKALGLCRCNIYSGGTGGTAEHWTDELRKEFSIHNPMKSIEQRKRMSINNPMRDILQRERMSINNPMKNRQIAKIVAQKKSKPVIIGDTEYPSLLSAAESFGVTSTSILHWCKTGINPYGAECRYKHNVC